MEHTGPLRALARKEKGHTHAMLPDIWTIGLTVTIQHDGHAIKMLVNEILYLGDPGCIT
jgi:hypothetical protein